MSLLIILFAFLSITGHCQRVRETRTSETASLSYGNDYYESVFTRLVDATEFNSLAISGTLLYFANMTSTIDSYIQVLSRVQVDTYLILLSPNSTDSSSGGSEDGYILLSICICGYLNNQSDLAAYITSFPSLSIRQKALDDNLHIVLDLQPRLSLLPSSSSFLFLSLQGCSYTEIHELAHYLTAYPKTLYLLSIFDLLDVDDSKEEVMKIASIYTKSAMKSDYESLSTASSSISCNWNGPALALAFGSFYDAYYPFKSNEAIFINLIAPYGVMRKKPLIYALFNSSLPRVIEAQVNEAQSEASLRKSLLTIPSFNEHHCVVISWFNASNHLLFHSGCLIPADISITAAEYTTFYLKQGWNRLSKEFREKETTVCISLVYRLREIVLSPHFQQIQALSIDSSYQETPMLAKEKRPLVISSPVRSVTNITSQVFEGIHNLYLVRPGEGVGLVMKAQLQGSLNNSLSLLCNTNDDQCWRLTKNALFAFRSSDYFMKISAIRF
ncbi:hypothetical protein WA171_000468 [Blastocystis sp. BT1]